MYKAITALTGATFALSACASIPTIDDTNYVDVERIIRSVECEIREALDKPEYYWAFGWAGDLTLTLKHKKTAGGSGTTTLTIPIAPAILEMKLGAKPSLTRDASTKFTKAQNVGSILFRDDCDSSAEKIPPIGVGKWIRFVAGNATAAAVCPSDVDYTKSFTLSVTPSIKPSGIPDIKLGDSTLSTELSGTATKTPAYTIKLLAKPISPKDGKAMENAVRNVGTVLLGIEANEAIASQTIIEDHIRACRPFEELRQATLRALPARVAAAPAIRTFVQPPEVGPATLEDLKTEESTERLNELLDLLNENLSD